MWSYGRRSVILYGNSHKYINGCRWVVFILSRKRYTIKERSNKWKFTDLPSSPPVLWTSHKRYSPGDLLFANCSTAPSKPPAILSFKLNEVPVSDFVLLYWYLVRHIFYARLYFWQTYKKRFSLGHLFQ